MTSQPRTLLDKLWASHEVLPETPDTPAVLYVDLHLLHEISSPQGFAMLEERGLRVRRPERTLAVIDHGTPTRAEDLYAVPMKASDAVVAQLQLLRDSCRRQGIRLLDTADTDRGIVHVVGPELGLTHPGSLIVCGDSHTSTHGAFGALAFGIGSTELGHVLATQCLLQRKPRSLLVQVDGRLQAPATAKDLVLAIIRQLGAAGGTGCAIEYRGPGIEALSMEERMTVCNMSIEAGARAGMIAPDDVTFEYLRGRPHAPRGAEWDRAVAHWRTLRSDEGAAFDRVVRIDASAVRPTITWGTSPAQSLSLGEAVPPPPDAATRAALDYMGLEAGRSMVGLPVQVVFLGSCTNGRLSDLRAAAQILRGRKVAAGLRMLVVPGSQAIKRAAEAEGLDAVFTAAGAEWRESGCSMCNGINDDRVPAGAYCVSTSNRNFAGRQGVGSRTLLASPVVAAACAIAGKVVDPAGIGA